MAFGPGTIAPISPLSWLTMRSMQQDPNAQPSGGASPPAAPVDAPPPVAPAQPSPSSGGGIGGALSRAFSGAGIFGSDAGFGEIDPNTGLSKGDVAKANTMSMIKMGMLLMAAGARQSDDSRARILGLAAGAMDNSDQLNGFAQSRIAMAKQRLEEKKQLQEQANAAALIQSVSGGITPAATGGPAAPGVGAATTPIGTPLPVAAANGAPPAPDASGAPGVPPTPGMPATGQPSPVPAGISTSRPPPPPAPVWRAGPQDTLHMKALGTDVGKLSSYIAEQRNKLRDTRIESDPYYDPAIGVVVDVYQGVDENGRPRRVGTERKREADATVRTVPGPDGTLIIETLAPGTGQVTKREVQRDPIYDEAGKVVIKRVDEDYEKLKGTYDTEVKTAITGYDKLREMQNAVRKGEAITGTTASLRKEATRMLGSLGFGTEENIKKLTTTTAIQAMLGAEAGKFAKENYGPQVSEWDVRNAQQLLGAIESGLPEEIDAALERIRKSHMEKIQGYNSRAADFEERIKRAGKVNTEFYKPPKVDKTFDDPIDWTPEGKTVRAKETGGATGPNTTTGDKPPPGSPISPGAWNRLSDEAKNAYRKQYGAQ